MAVIATSVTDMLTRQALPAGLGMPHANAARNPEFWADVAGRMALHTAKPLRGKGDPHSNRARVRDRVIWASELGEKCRRKQWYKFHESDQGEELRGDAVFKFAYGNIIEEMALAYVAAAGFHVTNKQALVTEKLPNGWTIRGRIDAVVADHGAIRAGARVVDVKSCSSAAMDGYLRKPGPLSEWDDHWGYISQLAFYDNNKDQVGLDDTSAGAEFLFIDKQNGRMLSKGYEAPLIGYELGVGSDSWAQDIEEKGFAPVRGHSPQPEGTSGNMKLGTQCSYCAFKQKCWPGLRAFKYAKGPVFLTEVKTLPKVPEIPLVEPKPTEEANAQAEIPF